jgi:rhodanese-related sulfurtransferase
MSRRSLLLWLIVVLALVLTACGGKDKASYTTLTPQKAYDQLSTSTDAVIVDVRNPDEWTTTGIPVGAALIPLPEFEQRAPQELPKDKPIYVICNSGNRSRTASEILIKDGYKKVYNIDGGIQAWLRAGLPVEPYSP